MAIITISRQVGAGEKSIAPALAERLGWECIDRKLLHREVEETGIALHRLIECDERQPRRLEEGSHPQDAPKYFQALERIMQAYQSRGNLVIVGRGGNLFLQDADALHIRLVADMSFRVLRVMEHRWASEDHALEIIRESDRDRAQFFSRHFGADWDDPLHYHAILNTAYLGVEQTAETLASMARQRWGDACLS